MNDPRFSFISSIGTTARNESAIRSLLEDTLIRIIVADEASHTFPGQVATLQLATLLVRLFDRVALIGDEAATCAPDLPLLTGPRYLDALRSLLPTLRPLPTTQRTEQGRTVTVNVGRSLDPAHQGDLYVGATAWGARLSTTSPPSITDTRMPLGALAAGALGASEVFKIIFGDQIVGAYTAPDYSVSLLDYQPLQEAELGLPDHIHIDVTLFGCGSVGCAFLLGLMCFPQLHGKLTIVDNGRFDTRNPYKYALLDWQSAEQQWFKAVWAQRRITERDGDRLLASAFVGTAQEYVAGLPGDYVIPLAISAVDTPDARVEIQDTLPRRVVNAGVDGTEVEVSVHGFGEGPCLACLQLDAQLAAWDGKVIAEATGLAPDRVQELIAGNLDMSQQDIDTLKARPNMTAQQRADLDTFLGQPLLSYWRRVAYSEVIVRPGDESASAHVTTAFVSAYAGVLLVGELLKECVPELAPYRVENSYRQHVLGVPTRNVFPHTRDQRGWCLCHSNFRQLVYREKYESRTTETMA